MLHNTTDYSVLFCWPNAYKRRLLCTCLFYKHYFADTSLWDTLPSSHIFPKDHPPTTIRSGLTLCDICEYLHALYIFIFCFTLWNMLITGMKPRGLNPSLRCVFYITKYVYESELSLHLQKTKQEIITSAQWILRPMACYSGPWQHFNPSIFRFGSLYTKSSCSLSRTIKIITQINH